LWQTQATQLQAEIDALLAPLRAHQFEHGSKIFNEPVKMSILTPPFKRSPLQRLVYRMAESRLNLGEPNSLELLELSENDRNQYLRLKTRLAEYEGIKPDLVNSGAFIK